MSSLATIVALARVVRSLSIRPGGCSRLLSDIFLSSLACLSSCALTLQSFCCLTNLVNEGIGVDGSGTMDNQCRGHNVGCESCQLIRDAAENGTFILLISNVDSCSC